MMTIAAAHLADDAREKVEALRSLLPGFAYLAETAPAPGAFGSRHEVSRTEETCPHCQGHLGGCDMCCGSGVLLTYDWGIEIPIAVAGWAEQARKLGHPGRWPVKWHLSVREDGEVSATPRCNSYEEGSLAIALPLSNGGNAVRIGNIGVLQKVISQDLVDAFVYVESADGYAVPQAKWGTKEDLATANLAMIRRTRGELAALSEEGLVCSECWGEDAMCHVCGGSGR